MPPPEPRSSTVSPAFSSASAVGLPQPSDASSASAGMPAFCPSSYRSEVIGSHASAVDPQQPLDPPAPESQHDAASPSDTRWAISPYFFFTVVVMSVCASVEVVVTSSPNRDFLI